MILNLDAAPPELALFFAYYYKHLAPPEPRVCQSPVVRERSGSGFGLWDASSSNREITALRTRRTIPGANNAVGGLII